MNIGRRTSDLHWRHDSESADRARGRLSVMSHDVLEAVRCGVRRRRGLAMRHVRPELDGAAHRDGRCLRSVGRQPIV